MTDGQHTQIEWRGAVPVSTRFQDPYYSLDNGLAETEHVFLAGNDLPNRFTDGFHIAELGFGTGLNFLATWRAWQQSGHSGRLHFTSFEGFPMSAQEMAKSLSAFPEVQDFAKELLKTWNNRMLETETVKLTIIEGDARNTLPNWQGKADTWFLDGFAPAQNPELWEPSLMKAVADHTAPKGTFATYTAAGAVRRALADAGFTVTRIPGFGRKRHMTTGYLP